MAFGPQIQTYKYVDLEMERSSGDSGGVNPREVVSARSTVGMQCDEVFGHVVRVRNDNSPDLLRNSVFVRIEEFNFVADNHVHR